MHIKVGTRGSKLALWQSEYVISELKKNYPEHTYEVVVVRTKGDKIQNVSLNKIGDKGLFVKEIEDRLLDQTIDLAVHSMKDMPSLLPAGLTFSKCLKREDSRDVLVLRDKTDLFSLPSGARIGTGSKRREAQLKKLRSDLNITDIRGNLDTRLEKLDRGEYDGIVVAAAGLIRLGQKDRISSYFTLEQMVPASAQGALAIEVKQDRIDLLRLLNDIGDDATWHCILCEREFLRELNGSCRIPVGSHCIHTKDGYVLYAVYGDEDGTFIVNTIERGNDPIKLGRETAVKLKEEMRMCHER